MERAFRIYHYCIFIILNKVHLFVNKIDVVLLFFRIPYFKKKLDNKNLDLIEIDKKLWMNKKNGLNVYGADGILSLTLTFFLFSLFLFFSRGYDIDNIFLPVIFGCGIVSIFFTLRFGSTNDNYLQYIKEFELWSKREKMKYLLLSLLIIISIAILFFAGMIFNLSD